MAISRDICMAFPPWVRREPCHLPSISRLLAISRLTLLFSQLVSPPVPS